MSRRPHHLADLTYEEAAERIAAGAVALLPCGATEAHGPHLPLDTDVCIAEEGAARAAALLAAEQSVALVLPPVAYAVTEYAAEFGGTLSLAPEVAVSLVHGIALAASRAGFRGVVLCNAHLEPANIAALGRAAELARADGVPVAFPDVTRKPHALRLGEEFRSGACHAGRYETSLVLAARPSVVRGAVAEALPPNPASLSRAIRDGKRTFAEAGGPRAYFGFPADATAAEGEGLYAELADVFATAARELIG